MRHCRSLRTKSHSTLQCYCLTAHILEVRRCKLYACTSYLSLYVAVMSGRRHLNISLECIRISLLELLKLGSPCKRAYDIDIDSVRTPFCSRNSCKPTDTFLGSSVCTLSEVAEKSGTRRKVNYCSLSLLKIWITCLHVVECSIKT